jgi:hypothetical protein
LQKLWGYHQKSYFNGVFSNWSNIEPKDLNG